MKINTAAEARAKKMAVLQMLATRPLEMLIADFELLDARVVDAENPLSFEEVTVRGWIMDELANRNLEAFNAWMDDEDFEASPRKFFLR